MTKLQFDSLYYGKAVHCDTEEKAKEFLILAISVGYEWFGDAEEPDFTKWQIYKDDTHYFVKSFLWNEDSIKCGSSDFFLRYDIDCVEFIPQSQKFKVGDRVRIKDTQILYINGKVGVIERVNPLSAMSYVVRLDRDGWGLWYLTENELEKVEEPRYKEDINSIIEEIKEHQKSINALLNKLEMKVKVK